MWMKRANRRALATRIPAGDVDADQPRRLMPSASWFDTTSAHRDVSAEAVRRA
jgi:hypothetical protein